jgi:predicted SAM-dependent methyltransferase
LLGVRIRRAPDGRALLHVWRTGSTYEARNGRLFRNEWTSVCHSVLPRAHDPDQYNLDVRRPLPFASDSFDGIYAFHVVEHLDPDECRAFVGELFRVARPGAIVRVSTQDLEDMAAEYLRRLELALAEPTPANLLRHRWSVLELIDQMTRDRVGGGMLEAIRAGSVDRDYMQERFGEVADELLGSANPPPPPGRGGQLFESVRRGPRALWLSARRVWRRVLSGNHPRATGEANRWLYDHLWLQTILESQGFVAFEVRDWRRSGIHGWERYDFDSSSRGPGALEPSVYVEARKPGPPDAGQAGA